ncbi:MAG: exodeoxyribonuclease VII large subunit [Chloroflexi bacterium]|nr:exodeoxyribonuclease VII large subunit [Chloroflexota bacterium]
MSHDREPPDWALPAWDALDPLGRGGEGGSGRRDAGRPAGTPAATSPPATFGLRILGVSDVTRAVREALRGDPRLADVWVEGEVGRVTISSAGHAYFTLKDERSQLACVWFRDDRLASPFEARTGLRVVVHGRIDVFDAQGVYQCYVAAVEPAGLGDLALRFEATKARLASEGLFDAARKRPAPARPATVGIVTSLSGAVLHDVRRVLERRWPLARLVVSACRVQGDGAGPTIVAALERLARHGAACRAAGRPGDAPAVVILARGGGSLEDLWAFNEEGVVRAVARHPVPVVSGVGHATDVTLVDFAADVRAPTPSAAAELVVPDRAEVRAALRARRDRLDAALAAELAARTRRVAAERRALDGLRPEARLAAARERAGFLLDRATATVAARLAADRRAAERAAERLGPLAGVRLAGARARLEASRGALAALGPEATLGRGYAIVRRATDGTIVRDRADAPPGTALRLRVARGELAARSEPLPGG